MNRDRLRLLIIGAGGIGAYYAARLVDAGHPATLLARGAHLAAMQRGGLRVEHPDFGFSGAVDALDADELLTSRDAADFDLVLLTTKANSTVDLMRQLGDWIMSGPGLSVMSLQNGIDNEPAIAGRLGLPRTLGGLAVRIGGHVTEPGHVIATGPAQVVCGAWPNHHANYGVPTERIPAGELLETGERVRFTIPTGHVIELYARKTATGGTLPAVNPEAWSPEAEHGIAPIRMDHILLYGPDIDGAHAIFRDVLGFYLVEHIVQDDESDLAIWLSCSIKAHDIAFVKHDEPGKLHHIAFVLETWEKVLRAADLMSMHRVPIDIGPTRHGVTRGTTIYAFDPSGNRFETYCGGYQPYPDWQPTKWTMEEIGAGIFYHNRQLNEAFLTVLT
ncbi:MAG: VOC family protein [Chromatiales bacterium]|nr:VOC family protein [Chromatiales bacterium]